MTHSATGEIQAVTRAQALPEFLMNLNELRENLGDNEL
jgi:hypothetical protein